MNPNLLKQAFLSLVVLALLGIAGKVLIPVMKEMTADEVSASQKGHPTTRDDSRSMDRTNDEIIQTLSERLFHPLAVVVILFNATLILASLKLPWRAMGTILLPPAISFATDTFLFHQSVPASGITASAVLAVVSSSRYLYPREVAVDAPAINEPPIDVQEER